MKTDAKITMKKPKSSDKRVASMLPGGDPGGCVATAIGKLRNKEKSDPVDRMNKARKTPAETRQLRVLEDENQKLKQLVADLTLNKVMLREALARKVSGPNRKILQTRKRGAGSSNPIERRPD
jgi:putative transposase